MTFLRSTKIVATLGPASSDPDVLERMIRAGVDVVRLNFSHGTAAGPHRRAPTLVREVARARSAAKSAIMADLQGPKIRVGKFDDGKIDARAGRRRSSSTPRCASSATSERVGLDYKELPRDVEPGRRCCCSTTA